MSIQNEFLNQIRKSKYLMNQYKIKVYLIAGTGIETNKYLCIDKAGDYEDKWVDGKPKYSVETIYGDGTVTIESATAMYGKVKYIKGDHISILKDSASILSTIFNRKTSDIVGLNQEKGEYYVLSIFCTNLDMLSIKLRGRKKVIKKMDRMKDEEILLREIGHHSYCILIRTINIKDSEILIKPIKNKESRILIISNSTNKIRSHMEEIRTGKNYMIDLEKLYGKYN